MRKDVSGRLGFVAALIVATSISFAAPRPSSGDEPGRFRLSRLFRGASRSTQKPELVDEPAPLPPHSGPAISPNVSDNSALANGTARRIFPQPRTNRPVTDAEPILIRVGLIRADDGKQFGEFMQVFADGIVIDSEGVHRASREALRGLVDALRDADAIRASGHCGGPSTDFIEQVHLTVFDHSFGRLRANHFSYSGNPQGCEPSIRRLHSAIDSFMNQIRAPIVSNAPKADSMERRQSRTLQPSSREGIPASDSAPPPPELGGPSIPLTAGP